MQSEPEPESGRDGREGVCLRGKEGAQGEGVSHGRAPAALREPRPPLRPAPTASRLGQTVEEGLDPNFPSGVGLKRGPDSNPPPPQMPVGE